MATRVWWQTKEKNIYDFDLPQKKLHPLQCIAGLSELGSQCDKQGYLCNMEDIPLSHKMESPNGWGYPRSPGRWTYYSLDSEGRLINPHFFEEKSLELSYMGTLVPPKSELSEKTLQSLDFELMKKKSLICNRLYEITLPATDRQKRQYGFCFNPKGLILFNENLIPIKLFKFIGTYQSCYINSLGNLCFITDNEAFWKGGKGENYVRVYTIADADLENVT